ncbi:MAG: peptidoglycan-binding domain-containing protein [Proteobacteria bacterium]|nr:peptidoglycan-binding domain-containing protein [Pseudomonadota bacterium]
MATRPVRPIHPIPPIHPILPLSVARSDSFVATLDPGATATGDAIVALASRHIGEAYVLGARAPMANVDWKGPWDCAEFASWCVYQATGLLFGVEPRHDPMRADAYTGYWATQAREAGAMVDVDKAAGIAGALLLREPQSGRVGHIVISNGKGGTVEAHSSNDGVIAGIVDGRRWDCGILVPGVRYFASAAPVAVKPPPAGMLRLTDPMLRGEEIGRLQDCLAALGFNPGTQDGVYGPQTEAAVAAFQAANGLVVDGEYGAGTRKALRAMPGCRNKL